MESPENKFWNSEEQVEWFSERDPSSFVVENIGNLKGGMVLDHGCGAGRNSVMLSRRGFEVYGVDTSISMLEKALDNVGEVSDSVNGRFLEADIRNLPFENNFFDSAISIGVLHQMRNISEFESALSELKRVIKPDGTVIVELFVNSSSQDFDTIESFVGGSYVRTDEDIGMLLLKPEKVFEEISKFFELQNHIIKDVDVQTGKRRMLCGVLNVRG